MAVRYNSNEEREGEEEEEEEEDQLYSDTSNRVAKRY